MPFFASSGFSGIKKVGAACTPRGPRFFRARGHAAQRRTKTRGERAKPGRKKLERVRRASCGRAARATWVSSHCGPGVCELGWGSRRGGSASRKRGALVITRNREHHNKIAEIHTLVIRPALWVEGVGEREDIWLLSFPSSRQKCCFVLWAVFPLWQQTCIRCQG